jgi:hypothetical protein
MSGSATLQGAPQDKHIFAAGYKKRERDDKMRIARLLRAESFTEIMHSVEALHTHTNNMVWPAKICKDSKNFSL